MYIIITLTAIDHRSVFHIHKTTTKTSKQVFFLNAIQLSGYLHCKTAYIEIHSSVHVLVVIILFYFLKDFCFDDVTFSNSVVMGMVYWNQQKSRNKICGTYVVYRPVTKPLCLQLNLMKAQERGTFLSSLHENYLH